MEIFKITLLLIIGINIKFILLLVCMIFILFQICYKK